MQNQMLCKNTTGTSRSGAIMQNNLYADLILINISRFGQDTISFLKDIMISSNLYNWCHNNHRIAERRLFGYPVGSWTNTMGHHAAGNFFLPDQNGLPSGGGRQPQHGN